MFPIRAERIRLGEGTVSADKRRRAPTRRSLRYSSIGAHLISPSAASRSDPEPIEQALLTLRARVRTLAESRAQLAAAEFTNEIRLLSLDAAQAMGKACEGQEILARLHDRLDREVETDLSRGESDDDASVEARARQLVLSRLRAQLEPGGRRSRPLKAISARADFTPGTAEAIRIFEQYRGTIRHRFRELKDTLQVALAEVSLGLASATAARLCLQYGPQRREWLWSQLASIVDQFMEISVPLSLPASLEHLATQSLLSKLQRHRKPLPRAKQGCLEQ